MSVRPIIVAESASARFGGEAILPLHYFRFLRRRGIETWLVVHDRTRAELEDAFPADRDRIFYVRDRRVQMLGARLAAQLPDRLSDVMMTPLIHGVTQWAQRELVREVVARVGATVVHEPVPVSPKLPSMTYDVGVPVVIGPMNGGMTYPPGFHAVDGRVTRYMTVAARRAAGLMNALFPGKRKAAALLVANRRTREALPPGSAPRVIELVENGVDLSLFQPPSGPRPPRRRPRFLHVGRLIPLKAVDLLLRAVTLAAKTVDLELHLIGDGPERPRLERLAQELELGDRVVFRGFVPQSQCPAALADADALVLPSLHECGGAVVLEAMAMRLPIIATRWGGPADYLDDTCGMLVEPTAPEPFVHTLREALIRLATNPELRERLGATGRARVEREFAWERKIDRILEIYREVGAG